MHAIFLSNKKFYNHLFLTLPNEKQENFIPFKIGTHILKFIKHDANPHIAQAEVLVILR